MADYCTAIDVQVLLGYTNPFSTTTKPTAIQVAQEIANVTNELDFYMRGVGLTVQPTDANILGRMRMAASYGAACRIGMGAKGNGDVSGSQPEFYCTRYQEILTEIKETPGLYGTVSGDSIAIVSSHVLDGTYTETEMNDLIIDDKFIY